MEIHSVLPEERARDPKGDTLPWGYRHPESARSKQAEETGAFGSRRSLRASGTRTSRSRAGTTPQRSKEDAAVTEFGRLFAKSQARNEEPQTQTNTNTEPARPLDPEAIATECYLFGYANKASEWKVISKYERVVAPSIICEDYLREDPNLFMSESPLAKSRNSVVVHKNLSRDALRKSRVYKGGKHWLKVTFDSYQAAECACFFSPINIDGYSVYCEMYHGRGPTSDIPLLTGSEASANLIRSTQTPRTLPVSQSNPFLPGKDSAIAGFERAISSTLPRSHTLPDVQYTQPTTRDDISLSPPSSTDTASSATATAFDLGPPTQSGIRSRSVPYLPSQTPLNPTSEFMTHIPSVKKIVLRPISEALPKQPTFTERVLRSLPIVTWFVGSPEKDAGGAGGGWISDGPVLKEDGNWDQERNGGYWRFWFTVDGVLGTDFCGLKEE